MNLAHKNLIDELNKKYSLFNKLNGINEEYKKTSKFNIIKLNLLYNDLEYAEKEYAISCKNVEMYKELFLIAKEMVHMNLDDYVDVQQV